MLFMKYHWVNQSIYVISEEEQSIYSCYWLNNNNNINIDSTLQKFDTPEINLNNWLLSKTLAVAYILNIVFEQMAINFACFSEIFVFSLFFFVDFSSEKRKSSALFIDTCSVRVILIRHMISKIAHSMHFVFGWKMKWICLTNETWTQMKINYSYQWWTKQTTPFSYCTRVSTSMMWIIYHECNCYEILSITILIYNLSFNLCQRL